MNGDSKYKYWQKLTQAYDIIVDFLVGICCRVHYTITNHDGFDRFTV